MEGYPPSNPIAGATGPVGPVGPVFPAPLPLKKGNKFQGVCPSPILSEFTVVSYPGSPDCKTGFALYQFVDVSLLSLNLTFVVPHDIIIIHTLS